MKQQTSRVNKYQLKANIPEISFFYQELTSSFIMYRTVFFEKLTDFS